MNFRINGAGGILVVPGSGIVSVFCFEPKAGVDRLGREEVGATLCDELLHCVRGQSPIYSLPCEPKNSGHFLLRHPVFGQLVEEDCPGEGGSVSDEWVGHRVGMARPVNPAELCNGEAVGTKEALEHLFLVVTKD